MIFFNKNFWINRFLSNVRLELILCKEAVAALIYLPPEVVALVRFIPVPALTIFPEDVPILDTLPGLITPVIGLPLDVNGLFISHTRCFYCS